MQALIDDYATRVGFAVKHGVGRDTPIMEATELRSANASNEDYADDERALRLHTTSLFKLHKELPAPEAAILQSAISELSAWSVGADPDPSQTSRS